MSALRSAVAASLLLATPVLAAGPAPAPGTEQGPSPHGEHGHKHPKFERKLQRIQQRLDRAVVAGRLTQAEADQFKAEARQLHEEVRAQREAAGGQLSEEQREQLRERVRAFRDKVKSTLKAKDAPKP
jgi:hypothetical protein